MKHLTKLAGAAGLGAGLMYGLDPVSGRRRRKHARDRLAHIYKETRDAAGVTARDVANRLHGLWGRARSALAAERVEDDVLTERVRAALGRFCSHPGAVEVHCRERRVVLQGAVLARELERILARVGGVRGVREVESHLEVFQEPNGIPGLTGGAVRTGRRAGVFQRSWSPATRLMAGAAGAVITGWGARLRGLALFAVETVGLGLLARSLSNLELKRLVGVGAGRRAVDIQKTIHIHAPVEEVFAFWDAIENFPRFMTHVREIRRTGPNSFHWKVAGPAGAPFEWDGVITERVPNQRFAFKSAAGAIVGNAGVIQFQKDPRGGTTINIRMSYRPPAGALGHAFARLLGVDPKKQMDDDLVRLKSIIETGKATGREETVTHEVIPHAHVPVH